MSDLNFKNRNSFEKRKKESSRIILKYPYRIPIIVERYEKSSLSVLDKCKYLCPCDFTFGHFIYVIRKRLKLASNQALVVLIGNKLMSHHILISVLYEENKNDDGFLYMMYSGEDCFGGGC